MLKTATTLAFQIITGCCSLLIRGAIELHAILFRLRTRPQGLFLRELLSTPANIGAVWPSSKKLARCMASHLPPADSGLIVELGAGTGVVTAALLESGVSADRLYVIERSPTFVKYLRQRFPSVTILQGDAAQLASLLPADTTTDAIVSSLPLRSLPPADTSAIIEQWQQLLGRGKTVVQFTYALNSRLDELSAGFIKHDSQLVWGNLPPAKVVEFTRWH